MHNPTPSLLRHIYAKTPKGLGEIVRPKFGLNSRQRRLLMFFDGIRSLSALHSDFPLQEMEDIILVLSEQQFIHLIGTEQSSVCFAWNREDGLLPHRRDNHVLNELTHHSCGSPALLQDAEHLSRAKDFMLEIAAIHLGILGRDIVQKIEAAESARSLASLAGQWTMALCASKTASRYAQLYLERLKLILFEEQQGRSDTPVP